MNPAGSLFLILLAALTVGEMGAAQSLRLRTQAPPTPLKAAESIWPATFTYSVATDYADTRSPRGYTNSLSGSLGYKFNDTWSVASEVGMRAEFINGQVEKGQEQGYAEVVSPTTNFELDMDGRFSDAHKYSMFMHGEPLWDEASRLEGYKGLVGVGGEVSLNFFHKTYSFNNSLDVTELLNTFYYGSDLSPNPDYFFTYKMTHSVRFWGSYKLSYVFGLKTTRYLDGFWGYNYEDSFRLSKTWGQFTAAVSYDNGGFTDDGTVSLWFIDEYRRIGRFMVNYSF